MSQRLIVYSSWVITSVSVASMSRRPTLYFWHLDIHLSTVSTATKQAALPNYPFQESKRLKTIRIYLRTKYQQARFMNLILRCGTIFLVFLRCSLYWENQSSEHTSMSKIFSRTPPQIYPPSTLFLSALYIHLTVHQDPRCAPATLNTRDPCRSPDTPSVAQWSMNYHHVSHHPHLCQKSFIICRYTTSKSASVGFCGIIPSLDVERGILFRSYRAAMSRPCSPEYRSKSLGPIHLLTPWRNPPSLYYCRCSWLASLQKRTPTPPASRPSPP
jgi:hypothetical protein